MSENHKLITGLSNDEVVASRKKWGFNSLEHQKKFLCEKENVLLDTTHSLFHPIHTNIKTNKRRNKQQHRKHTLYIVFGTRRTNTV